MRTLALGAIGVVFGDIGTSPLYTLQEVFSEKYGLHVAQASVFGVLSLVFWALMLVVTLKYVMFVMRADNKGEGGIMALMTLAQRAAGKSVRARRAIMLMALLGAALFFGDGVITPSISVLSAVEGLQVAAPALSHYVVPITVAILLGLFWLQRHGTARIGVLFGPIMVLWFLALAVIGVHNIIKAPGVLWALNPYHAVQFFMSHGAASFLALGSVVLCVTGAEALYTDMGHFGRYPIRAAWFGFVMPALLLNYYGQGGLLLNHPEAVAVLTAWVLEAARDGMSVAEIMAAGCEVLGLRYRSDPMVGRRFSTLTRELGDAFLRVEFPGRQHATLTEHRQQEAVDRVLAFFDARLR